MAQNNPQFALFRQYSPTTDKMPQFALFKEGVQGQKSWKHNFEITGDPKGPPSGPTFCIGSEVPDPYGYL